MWCSCSGIVVLVAVVALERVVIVLVVYVLWNVHAVLPPRSDLAVICSADYTIYRLWSSYRSS